MNLTRIQPTACICPGCGQPAQAVTIGSRTLTECTPCAEAEAAAKRNSAAIAQAVGLWRSQTPQEYREPIDARRLHTRIARALQCDGTQGLALIGETHAGKTRVGYEMLRRAAARGIRARGISHTQIAQALVETYDADPTTQANARALLRDAERVPVLLLDDIGTGQSTERIDAALFAILTARRDNKLVTHWTANHGSSWLRQRFGENRGAPIVQRLSDLVSRDTVFVAG